MADDLSRRAADGVRVPLPARRRALRARPAGALPLAWRLVDLRSRGAYEREGDVGNVAFPCGYTLGADGDTINLYYGAADTSIALATGSIRQLLGWLDEHGTG